MPLPTPASRSPRRWRHHGVRPRPLRHALFAALLALACGTATAAGARAQDSDRSHAAPTATTFVVPGTIPPHDATTPRATDDVAVWLEYRTRNHLAALPLEARLYYRRGLLLAQSGAREEAIRLVRAATDLDPTYVAPHLTLASWQLLREPSQALLQYASVIDLAREDFLFQLALAANTLTLCFQALLLGFLAAALLVVALRNRELRHIATERLRRFTSPVSARAWSWGLLVLPFAAGFGLALPALFCLALLWPLLRVNERAVFVGLLVLVLSAPWAAGSLDRLALPLRDGAPFHGVAWTATGLPPAAAPRDLAALAAREPDDALVQYAAAWSAARHGDLATAEAGYRRVLELRPDDDRALDALGNVLAMGGHANDALVLFERASATNPNNAAAAFNASQVHTQRYDYKPATEALARASALDFELVRGAQRQSSDDGVLTLLDPWIAPRTMWTELRRRSATTAARGALPPDWRGRIEFTGWGTALALLLAALGLVLGSLANRAVPLRVCSNCGAVVCRRCACRRREVALCPSCAAAEAAAEEPDFGRVLLARQRRQARHRSRLVCTALATLLPGYGLLAHRRVVPALVLLCSVAALALLTLGRAAPIACEPRVTVPAAQLPLPMLVGLWVVLYALSFLGYLAQVLRADAEENAMATPVRSRIRFSNRNSDSLAA
jgi:tetratricopeptide (TPR) repeat protein